MKVTIIGCGNSGLIHAAKLIEKGHKVAILKSSNNVHEEFYDVICSEGGYNVKDETSGGNRYFAKPEFITRDAEKAISFADVIMVMTTTLQHERIAKLISPYVRDGQIIVLVPGYMGSLIFRKFISKQVIYSEWETTAYNGRIIDSMYVRITFYNPRNAISVLPISKTDVVLNILSTLFDNTKYTRKHILESALHNPNMIVHTIGTTLSASRIEYSRGEFWMYREAFTPSVINVINAFDKQKNEILQKFGCEPLNYFEAAKWRNTDDLTQDAMDVFKSFAASSNKGPSSLNGRYLSEDVPMGLVLFSSIGQAVGINTDISNAIIQIASGLLARDLSKNGRTIDSLLDMDRPSFKDIMVAITE